MCISSSKRAIQIDIVAFSSVDNDYAFVLKNIWVLGVSLYLCYLADIFQQDVMEVWLMNEHSISESWTRIVVLEDASSSEVTYSDEDLWKWGCFVPLSTICIFI
jgi:hypothetical protein